ncbi:hypothetical protein EDD76_110142 [Kineothrix alysoides]|uniref:Uncharacterized protein n=1 Tax=Kineothrix alysoides TaxID=1469948 RepID=A0A4R1QST4_9FIRM|nr:hypothetical protein EDD76_110142 [Kineothrix alysoides]
MGIRFPSTTFQLRIRLFEFTNITKGNNLVYNNIIDKQPLKIAKFEVNTAA